MLFMIYCTLIRVNLGTCAVERNDEMLMKFKQVICLKYIHYFSGIICALVGVGYGVYKNMTYKEYSRVFAKVDLRCDSKW